MKHLLHLILSCLCIFLLSCKNDDDPTVNTSSEDFTVEVFEDPRDGKAYDIVTIGDQTWFAENLAFELGEDKSLCYAEIASNCFTHGRLYRPDDALSACPNGWKVPSEEEWEQLFDYLGGVTTARYLLSTDAEILGDEVNFNLLPAGRYWSSTLGFEQLNQAGYYWTSTEGNSQFATTRYVYFVPNSAVSFDQESPGRQFSCRCLRE